MNEHIPSFGNANAYVLIATWFLPWDVFVVGASVLVLLTLMHAAGLYGITCQHKAIAQRIRARRRYPLDAALLFGWVTLLLLLLHVAEMFVWASVLYALEVILRFRDAFYFCANSYTTIGNGADLIPPTWREISPLIAISGLFTFGFTTSTMFKLVRDNNQLVTDLAAAHGK